MSAYIITNSELVAIANAIRNKNSSNETFTLEQIPNAIATIGENIGSGAVIKTATNDKYIINDIKLINIANAIRNKLNISDKITVANMPNLINNIDLNLITDSWDTIIANIDNGTYKTAYKVGNYKPLEFKDFYGTTSTYNMQIVAFDTDVLTDGNGYAPITFISMETAPSTINMNTKNISQNAWNQSLLRQNLLEKTLPSIPSTVREHIVSVDKVTYASVSSVNNISAETIWIPSMHEIYKGRSDVETQGATYYNIYNDANSRIKKRVNGQTGVRWTRTQFRSNTNSFYVVDNAGNAYGDIPTQWLCYDFGFCLGLKKYTVNYYNGSTLLYSEKVKSGNNSSYTGITPIKVEDAQYTYSFVGWSKDDDNTVDSDALTNVVADRNVYACFTSTLRKYTVTFVRSFADGGGTLQTINNVNYGTVITAASSYTGTTPTTTQGNATDYPFEGWNPASAIVIGDTTFTAKFGGPIDISEISDTWDQIIENIDNGTYNTKYKIGQYKPLDLGDEGTINMQIVAMDADELANNGEYAPLTFIAIEALKNRRTFGSQSRVSWDVSIIRTWLNDTLYPIIPLNIKNRIQPVIKYYSIGPSNPPAQNSIIDKVWIPSDREIRGSAYYEKNGPKYIRIYKDNSARQKHIVSNSYNSRWWIRSNEFNTNLSVAQTGAVSTISPNNYLSIVLGFCLGLEVKTTTNS